MTAGFSFDRARDFAVYRRQGDLLLTLCFNPVYSRTKDGLGPLCREEMDSALQSDGGCLSHLLTKNRRTPERACEHEPQSCDQTNPHAPLPSNGYSLFPPG